MTRQDGNKVLDKYTKGQHISKKAQIELQEFLKSEIRVKYRYLMQTLNGHEDEELYVEAKSTKLSEGESLASLIVTNEEMTRLVFRLFAPDFPSYNEDMPDSNITNEVLAKTVFYLSEPDSSSYEDNLLDPLDYNGFLLKKYGDYWYAKMSPKEKAGFFFVNSQMNDIPEARLRASLQESIKIFYRCIRNEFEERESLDDETFYLYQNLINYLLSRAVSTLKGFFTGNESQERIDDTIKDFIRKYQNLIFISTHPPKTIEKAKAKLHLAEDLTDKLVARKMTNDMILHLNPLKTSYLDF